MNRHFHIRILIVLLGLTLATYGCALSEEVFSAPMEDVFPEQELLLTCEDTETELAVP